MGMQIDIYFQSFTVWKLFPKRGTLGTEMTSHSLAAIRHDCSYNGLKSRYRHSDRFAVFQVLGHVIGDGFNCLVTIFRVVCEILVCIFKSGFDFFLCFVVLANADFEPAVP